MRNFKILIILIVSMINGFAFADVAKNQDQIEFIPGKDSGFYYTIQKGDTLWDLSQKFYNSQWDWPGLWGINQDIKNPHWIYPGNKIRVYLKDSPSKAPVYVPVKKAADLPEPVLSFSYPNMDKIGFIKTQPMPSLGDVIKNRNNDIMMSQNDIIYIRPSGTGSLIPGNTYQVFTTTSVREKIGGKKFKGTLHIIKAKIKVLEYKDDYATAVITENHRPVSKGDLIMDYVKRPATVEVQEMPPGSINARIIRSEENHMMINDYFIAFINAGSSMVKPGQIYSIYRENNLPDQSKWVFDKNKSISFEDLKSGKLIVLHTEDKASTVMIMSSTTAIHTNDLVY